MKRGIYSKYSLYEAKVKKGRINFFLLLLMFSLIGLAVFFWKNFNNTSEIDPPAPDVEGEAQVIEDKPEDLITWWNYDYSSYRQITVRNYEPTSVLKEGDLVEFKFNHKKIVDSGKSSGNGDDLRLVYINKANIYTELETNIENPNTSYTTISYRLINEINPNSNDNKYFLYYENPSSQKHTKKINETDKISLNYLITYSKEKSPKLTGSVNRKWILKDDPDPRNFIFSVDADLKDIQTASSTEPSKIDTTYVILGTNKSGLLPLAENGKYETILNVKDLAPGIYYIQAIATTKGMELKSQKVLFNVSYPLYVTWTIDWEGYDVNENFLADMADISTKHDMPITQLFNPKIYVDNNISVTRRNQLTKWILSRQSQGDEIGLHLHMHYEVVAAADVTVKKQPVWGGREDGHDVPTSAYTTEEMVKILNWSKSVFNEKGLGVPVSFRAGGWFANGSTLKALEKTEFKLDSSGRTLYSWGPNKLAGNWNLLPTTRPYMPSANNQNVQDTNSLDIWEFPNNGADSWSYSTNQLISRFTDNYKQKPLMNKQVVTYLSHPHWFNVDKPKVEETFNYIDKHLYKDDNGPVKYVTLEAAEKIWDKYPN